MEEIKNPIIIGPPSTKKGEIRQCFNCKNNKECCIFNDFGNILACNSYEED